MTETAKAKKLDVRGEICPYPMMKASEAMQKAKPGEVIEVLTDHPPALLTIPNEAVRLGWDVKIERVRSAEWKLTLSPSVVKEEAK
ncbi:MAG: sulfurtransferase TusA family protein [Chloroflexi bacterium]|nr:sulfurtransferase TusA family protein [Chloroflexota bacterium]